MNRQVKPMNRSLPHRQALSMALPEPESDASLTEQVFNRKPIPLSFAQQRLWFLEQIHPGTAAHNIARAIHLRGALNLEILQRVLDEIIRRHESLRTCFAVV